MFKIKVKAKNLFRELWTIKKANGNIKISEVEK